VLITIIKHGQIRGLLCIACNTIVGFLESKNEMIFIGKKYIEYFYSSSSENFSMFVPKKEK
jgi:hypothetical protein